MWESVTEWQFIEETLGTVVTVLGVWILYGFVRRMGRRLVQEMTERGEDGGARAASLWSLVRRVILIAFLATGGLMVIAVWGLPLAPFLAVGSAAGVAIVGARGLVRMVKRVFIWRRQTGWDNIKGCRTGQVVTVPGAILRTRRTPIRAKDFGGSVSIVFPRVTEMGRARKTPGMDGRGCEDYLLAHHKADHRGVAVPTSTSTIFQATVPALRRTPPGIQS